MSRMIPPENHHRIVDLNDVERIVYESFLGFRGQLANSRIADETDVDHNLVAALLALATAIILAPKTFHWRED